MNKKAVSKPIKRYPARTQLFDGESYQSYRLRFASRTIDTANEIARVVQQKRALTVYFSPQEMTAYSQITGLPLNQVKRLMPIARYPRDGIAMTTFLGQEFPANLVDQQSRRVCLECIRLAPYHRAIWSLTGARACEQHHVALISDCPQCLEPLTWKTNSPIRCGKCRYDLSKTPSTPHLHLDEDRVVFFLQHLLSGTLDLPEGLSDLTPYEFLYICSRVGLDFCWSSTPGLRPLPAYRGYLRIMGDREKLVRRLKELTKPWLIRLPRAEAIALAAMQSIHADLAASQRGKWMLDVLERVFSDFPVHLHWQYGFRGALNIKPEVLAHHREQDRLIKESNRLDFRARQHRRPTKMGTVVQKF